MTTARSPLEPGAELPARLEEVRLRFEEWRRTRPTKACSIPPELWTAAASCAAEHGTFRTAQVLGLDSGKLKRQMLPGSRRGKKRPPRFVELVPASRPPATECLLEIEHRTGSRLRMQLKGASLTDLLEIARSFRQEGS